MLAWIISDIANLDYILRNPWLVILMAFQLWMLFDAIRRQEWIWVIFIILFPLLNAILYYFLVYRNAPSAGVTQGFELPGSYDRRRIKELEAHIHHLDKAHHHAELGNIYFQQGKLSQAEQCYKAALERDSEDTDTKAHLGQCLLRQGRAREARPLLEAVIAQNPQHEYGHTMMALAETLMKLGETERAIDTWREVLGSHSYARARVQLAELYLAQNNRSAAIQELEEVLADDAHSTDFQRKRDRVWIRQAKKLLKSARSSGGS